MGNDPLNKTDPTVDAAGVDDAIGAIVGGLIGLSIQGYKDIFSLATGGVGGLLAKAQAHLRQAP